MKRDFLPSFLSLVLMFLTACSMNAKGALNREDQESEDKERSAQMKLIGWIPSWDEENAFASYLLHASLFHSISFFWYWTDAAGAIHQYEDTEANLSMLTVAKENGTVVLATVTNLPESGEWDPQGIQQLISDREGRRLHIRNLLSLVEEKGFDGIDIDYEGLDGAAREDFTQFISELSEELHARGKILGIALHPKTSENDPWEDNGSHAQDFLSLSSDADHLYFMAFGEHYAGGKPGPVASISWVKDNLHYAIDVLKIPTEKFFLELPLFGETWVQSKRGTYEGLDEELTIRDADQIRQEMGAALRFDELSQSPSFTYKQNGKQHIVWYENGLSLQAKLGLAMRYGITNIALWRLGAEPEELWPLLNTFRKIGN